MKRIFNFDKPSNCMVQVSTDEPQVSDLKASLQKLKASSFFLLVDRNLLTIHEALILQLKKALNAPLLSIEGGELCKDYSSLGHVHHWLCRENADRKSVLIVIGGGTMTDLGGFAASTFLRGIRTVYLPTSMMSMVDAALGGKTAINLGEGKNLVGSFWSPEQVFIYLNFLNQLPEREFKSSFSEVIKYGLLFGGETFETIEENWQAAKERKNEALFRIINCCIASKMQIVEEDFTESTSRRKLLNLGHTIAHVIESLGDYKNYLHGEAVSLGLIFSLSVSAIAGGMPVSVIAKTMAMLNEMDLPIDYREFIKDEKVLRYVWRDKKRIQDKLHFVLVDRPGSPRIQEITKEELEEYIKQAAELMPKAYTKMGGENYA